VEITRRYANRLDLAGELARTVGRLAVRSASADEHLPYEAGMAERGRRRSVRAALTEEQVQQIVASFAAGTPKHRLAVEHGMSLSTLKRLLRVERSRLRPASAAAV
jgi:hypothetical protein